MADKDITIGLKTTGGDQAAAEVKKLQDAVEPLKESEVAAAELGKLAGSTGNVAKAAPLASSSLGSLGSMLVSLAGGPIGLASLAIGAVVAGLNKWKQSLDDWEERQSSATDAYEKATEKTIDLTNANRIANEIQQAAKQRAEDHAEAIRQLTKAKSADIEVSRVRTKLLKEDQQAENEIAAAKAATAIAAETDPVKKEEVTQQKRKEQQSRDLSHIAAEKKARQDTLDRLERDQKTKGVDGANLEDELLAKAEGAKKRAEELSQLEILAAARRDVAAKTMQDKKASFGEQTVARRDYAEAGSSAKSAGETAKKLEAEAADYTRQADEIAKTTKSAVDGIVTEMNRLYQEIQKLDLDSGTKSAVFAERDKLGDITVNQTRDEEAQKALEKADAEQRKQAAEAARRAAFEKSIRDAGRDLETDIIGLGQDAAGATRGLGARGINPEGFNTLAKKIAKKGDAAGDKLNLSTFLSKVSALVDAIPDSKSGSEDAQKLREVELKIERKLEILSQQIKNKK